MSRYCSGTETQFSLLSLEQKGAIVNGEAGCTVCSQARLLKAVFPVTKGYELKRYECASCRSDLWLVTRVSRSSAPKQQSGRSRRGTRLKTIEAALRGGRGTANPKLKGRPT